MAIREVRDLEELLHQYGVVDDTEHGRIGVSTADKGNWCNVDVIDQLVDARTDEISVVLVDSAKRGSGFHTGFIDRCQSSVGEQK